MTLIDAEHVGRVLSCQEFTMMYAVLNRIQTVTRYMVPIFKYHQVSIIREWIFKLSYCNQWIGTTTTMCKKRFKCTFFGKRSTQPVVPAHGSVKLFVAGCPRRNPQAKAAGLLDCKDGKLVLQSSFPPNPPGNYITHALARYFGTLEDDFVFPQVGYVSSMEGKSIEFLSLWMDPGTLEAENC